MRRMIVWSAFVTVFAALAFAGSWSGTLIDANCYRQQKTAKSCAATSSTTAFALDVSGKVYELDQGGNDKAAAALRNRADRSANPDAQATPMAATVTGTKEGSTLQVDAIQVQ